MKGSILLIILLISSCKKEDILAPEISIIEPSNNISVVFGDFLQVEANIKDDRGIKTVTLELWDESFSRRHNYKSFKVSELSYALNSGFMFDDIHLSSGQYYIKVSATDEMNTESDFISLSYTEAPKLFEGFLLAVNTGNTYELKGTDISGQTNTILALNADYLNFEFDAWNQKVYVAHEGSLPLNAYDWSSFSQQWSIPEASNDWFKMMTFNEPSKQLYVSTKDGKKKLYNSSGNVQTIIEAFQPNSIGEEYCIVGNEILIDERLSDGSHTLALYTTSTGILNQNIGVDGDVFGLFEISQQEVLLFILDGITLEIKSYNTTTNSLQTYHGSITQGLKKVIPLNQGRYLVATDQDVRLYTLATNIITIFSSDAATDIEYESLNQTIYMLDNNQLRLYDINGVQQSSTSFSGGTNIELLYNK